MRSTTFIQLSASISQDTLPSQHHLRQLIVSFQVMQPFHALRASRTQCRLFGLTGRLALSTTLQFGVTCLPFGIVHRPPTVACAVCLSLIRHCTPFLRHCTPPINIRVGHSPTPLAFSSCLVVCFPPCTVCFSPTGSLMIVVCTHLVSSFGIIRPFPLPLAMLSIVWSPPMQLVPPLVPWCGLLPLLRHVGQARPGGVFG